MTKLLRNTNKVVFAGAVTSLLVSLLTAPSAWAKYTDDDSSGYLSNKAYNLSRSYPTQSSVIQIIDPDAPDKVFEMLLSFSTRGTDVHDDNVKATTSASVLGVELNWNITNSVRAQFVGGFQFASGNAATLYGSETDPYTGPSIDEGSFSVKIFPTMEVSGGIVNTEFNPISSTFSGGGFSGFRQVLSWEAGAFVGSLKGYQVAPSSLGLANRALDDEKNPFLTVANVNLGLKFDRFNTAIAYAKYDFYGMTSASAKDSRYIGNSVIGDGTSVVYYRYKFRGQEVAANAQLTFRLDDKLGVSGNITQNDEAPEKRNAGWMTRGYYEYNFGRYALRPSITRFRFEPDLMPAFFSHGSLGYLNRDGYSGEIRGTLKKYKLDAFVRYLDAKEVEPKPAQSDRIAVTVGMEVKYELL